MIRSTKYVLLIFMVLGAVFILSCSNTGHQQQLLDIIASLRSASSSLGQGKELKARIVQLDENQLLVVINSGYTGSIKTGSLISKELVREIVLNYAVKETGETFFVLLQDKEIVASSSVPGLVFQTSGKPFLNNAKIATPNNRVAILTCINLGDSPNKKKWDYWSPNCKTIQLIRFSED